MIRILIPMRPARLRDYIRMPDRNSAFASFLSAVIVLLAFVTVWKALKEQGLLGGTVAATIPAIKERESVTLIATDDHRFFWNDQGPYPLEESGTRLGNWAKGVRKPEVLIAGDDNARLADTLQLVNSVRLQGIESYMLETRVRARP